MNNTIPKLVLIDSNALIHRAYHGMPPLTTKDGTLVNAVYGFTKTVFKAIDDFKPKYIAAAFDVKGPTHRHIEYKDYKAHRPPAPEGLIKQFQLVKEVCNVLNIPIFGISGYEADDIIGTIVEKMKNKEVEIIIITGDMDALQLVNEKVEVYTMSRGINQAVTYNTEKVQEKYGFLPIELIDYKALRGDPSDNIPGVPGIGDKTATEIIKNFHSIENLYNELPNKRHTLSNKVEKLIIDYKEQAYLSKKLATIMKDVPLSFDLTDALVHDYDKKKAEVLFKKFEFRSLIEKLPEEKRNNKQESLF